MGSLSEDSSIQEVFLKKFTQMVIWASVLLFTSLAITMCYTIVSNLSGNITVCETFFLVFKFLEVAIIAALAYPLRHSAERPEVSSTSIATSINRVSVQSLDADST
jgi:hypothetical protein